MAVAKNEVRLPKIPNRKNNMIPTTTAKLPLLKIKVVRRHKLAMRRAEPTPAK